MRSIPHPRRLLVIGEPGVDLAGFVKDLTGSEPVRNSEGSVAGSIHEWSFTTKYYSASLPVWIDKITDLQQWKADFMGVEAKEVIEAVGGWIFCFDRRSTPEQIKATMEAIDGVINQACNYSWDGVKLAVALSNSKQDHNQDASQLEELDDCAVDHGFELINANASGKNDFGEQQGLARVVECIEANDWNATSAGTEDDFDVDGALDEQLEMNDEFWDMKASLLAGTSDPIDEAHQLEDFEALLSSAQAIKGNALDLNT